MIDVLYVLLAIDVILTIFVLFDITMSDLKGKELIFAAFSAVFPILVLGFIIARYFN